MTVDARVARTHAAVLRTATDLLVEGGPSAVTVDAIVARSGVAKSTIYRHWDSRDDILVDVIERCAPNLAEPAADLDFEAALRSLVADICATLADPEWARVFPALLTLRNHKDGVADLEQRLEARQNHAIDVVLQRGIAERRLPPDLDLDRAGSLLVGPLLLAHLMAKPALDDAFSTYVVEAFLRAVAEP
jgi:AcrR family transcriptional regulator